VDNVLLAILILILITLAVLAAAATFVVWRVWRSDERRLARRIGKLSFGNKLSLGGDLFRDPRIPIWTRVVALALVLYLASPIDLLPDFIPVIGFFDDILIVMIGAGLLIRSIPRYIIDEHIERYELRPPDHQPRLPAPRAG
jgi:uncharacterized membrane protein YkvA (DUF1232 family)